MVPWCAPAGGRGDGWTRERVRARNIAGQGSSRVAAGSGSWCLGHGEGRWRLVDTARARDYRDRMKPHSASEQSDHAGVGRKAPWPHTAGRSSPYLAVQGVPGADPGAGRGSVPGHGGCSSGASVSERGAPAQRPAVRHSTSRAPRTSRIGGDAVRSSLRMPRRSCGSSRTLNGRRGRKRPL